MLQISLLQRRRGTALGAVDEEDIILPNKKQKPAALML